MDLEETIVKYQINYRDKLESVSSSQRNNFEMANRLNVNVKFSFVMGNMHRTMDLEETIAKWQLH